MKEGAGRRPIKSGVTNENGGVEAPPWVAEFLATLIVTGRVAEAVKSAGTDFDTAWQLRLAEPEFAHYWDRASQAHRRIAAGIGFAEAVADDTASLH